MTFDELIAEVYDITNRPDLVTATNAAVKAATLKAHQSDYFSKDIFETGIEFPTADFRQSLDYVSLYSNWRALKYLRRVEDETDDVGAFFMVLTPEETIDSYGVNKVDVAYVAGRVLEIRSRVEFSKALLGCYVRPIVTPDEAYVSWVAEQHPYAIIHEAARRIFTSIGQLEEAAGQRLLVAEEYIELKMTGLTDVGS